MSRKQSSGKFYPHHITVRCPLCKAAVGSRCRTLDGSRIEGIHSERKKLVNSKKDFVRVKI